MKNLKIVKDVFSEWDCSMSSTGRESVGASIFNLWESELISYLFKDFSYDEEINNRLTRNVFFDNFFFRKVSEWSLMIGDLNADYCRNQYNSNSENPCVYNILKAFDLTITKLQD